MLFTYSGRVTLISKNYGQDIEDLEKFCSNLIINNPHKKFFTIVQYDGGPYWSKLITVLFFLVEECSIRQNSIINHILICL